MKRFLVAILCFIMGCIGLVGCTKEPEPTPTQTVEKSISYFAVIDGETKSVPAGMLKKDGTYPEKYVVGTGATISELVEFEENGFKYTFGGWFVDEALATAFEKIDKTADDDIEIFAKVTKTAVEPAIVTWNIDYKQVVFENGQKKTGESETIKPNMYKDNENYPITYVEGTSATISELQDYTEGYNKWEFKGWYTDKDCTKTFDGTISADRKENVTLYAKVVYTDLTPQEPANDDGNWTKNY